MMDDRASEIVTGANLEEAVARSMRSSAQEQQLKVRRCLTAAESGAAIESIECCNGWARRIMSTLWVELTLQSKIEQVLLRSIH